MLLSGGGDVDYDEETRLRNSPHIRIARTRKFFEYNFLLQTLDMTYIIQVLNKYTCGQAYSTLASRKSVGKNRKDLIRFNYFFDLFTFLRKCLDGIFANTPSPPPPNKYFFGPDPSLMTLKYIYIYICNMEF